MRVSRRNSLAPVFLGWIWTSLTRFDLILLKFKHMLAILAKV